MRNDEQGPKARKSVTGFASGGASRPYVLWLEWSGFYTDASLNQPQVVSREGLVLDANPSAQARGIRLGMSLKEARNIAPEAVCVPWREESYAVRQKAWLDLCLPFCNGLEPVDGHIAAIDLSGHPRPEEVAERLAETLVRETGLPLRSGAGPSKWLAALAARDHDLCRAVDSPSQFLAPLSTESLTPVHPAHRERLAFLGYRRIGDVARLSLSVLQTQFGEGAWRILKAAQGSLADPVLALYPVDSVQASHGFEGSPETVQGLEEGLTRVASDLAGTLACRGVAAKRVELTLEHEGGDLSQLSRTFSKPLTTAHDLLNALRLMLSEPPEAPIERARVRLPDLLQARRVQLGLDDRRARDDAAASLTASLHNVRLVFGDASVRHGSEIVSQRWERVRRAYRDAFGWAWV